MSRFRHDMKLAFEERARRAPVVIDLDRSQWHEVGKPSVRAAVATRASSHLWLAATILILGTVAVPLVDVVAHHVL